MRVVTNNITTVDTLTKQEPVADCTVERGNVLVIY